MSAGRLLWVCEGCGELEELPADVAPLRDDHGRPTCAACLARARELGAPSLPSVPAASS